MSTFSGISKQQKLESTGDLAGYFQAHTKKAEAMLVGLETEFFGVDRETGQAIPFDGPAGVEAFLRALQMKFGYEPLTDEGRVIGLSRSDQSVALEPGGQLELSAAPVTDVFRIEEQLRKFIGELKTLQADFPDVAWLAAGIHPFSGLDRIPWVPKRRYAIMREYFEGRGRLSHHMMKRTATNQINVDYTDEANAMAKMRTVLGITSIVTALFSHSSFALGKPSGYACERLEIWNHTDPKRTGLLIEFTRPDKTFKDYLDYILDMPMIFIVRESRWLPVKNQTFRTYLQDGYEGAHATLGDFELHLSTAFPEARFKQYLEIRGVDCQAPALIPVVAAFWKGILYDPATCEKAWQLVSFADERARLQLHQEVPRKGLKADLAGRPVLPIARELVELSCRSLGKQIRPKDSRDECAFLERIRERISRPGKSPGERLLEAWQGELGQNPRKLVEYLSVI